MPEKFVTRTICVCWGQVSTSRLIQIISAKYNDHISVVGRVQLVYRVIYINPVIPTTTTPDVCDILYTKANIAILYYKFYLVVLYTFLETLEMCRPIIYRVTYIGYMYI
jgi:hypothetical protein